MTPFVLDPSMLTMGGVFYPKGHIVIMFPNADDAQSIGRELLENGLSDRVMHIPPETVLREISRTEDGNDAPLPSVGTEGAVVRTYDDLARKGHHGLMVHAEDEDDTEAVMAVVRKVPFSYAQKYRMLVIQDLE